MSRKTSTKVRCEAACAERESCGSKVVTPYCHHESAQRVAHAVNHYAVHVMFARRMHTNRVRLTCPGYSGTVKFVEAEVLINARSSTVWDVITDGGNLTVWDSGITEIHGEIRNGGTIRIRTALGGNRMFRLRVEQLPGEVMTWTGGIPLGLFTGVRTFTLTSHGTMTHLRVREEFSGPLLSAIWKRMPDMEPALDAYVKAAKARAELFG